MMAGALNVSSAHPILTFAFLALMLALACTIWVELSGIRLAAMRRRAEAERKRPIRIFRA